MALTLCHTGDWHLGHTLHRRDREEEHRRFLAWLVEQLVARAADALIVAGDVFDSGSPSGAAQAMFYGFLADVRRRLPELCIVVVAGNHDSPARLAAPDPVLRGQGVWIVGSVPYERGEIAPERLVVPVVRGGEVLGRVVAVPFLRGADLPPGPEEPGLDAYARGARRVYDAALAHARAVRAEAEPLVVTGHFAAAGARMSRESERLLVGGIDGTLPVDVIDVRDVGYVALGHLHLAQRVDAGIPGQAEVRYSGSPIPLSFAERDFQHEVRFVRLDAGGVRESEAVCVPRAIDLVRIPAGGTLERSEAIAALEAYPVRAAGEAGASEPWVEVRARAGTAERDVVEALEAAAEGRALQLVHVVVERPEAIEAAAATEARSATSLDVRDVLVARWLAEHGAEPPAEVMDALGEALAEARRRLDERRPRGVELEVAPAIVRAPSVAARRRELGD